MNTGRQEALSDTIIATDAPAVGVIVEDVGYGLKRLSFFMPHKLASGDIERRATASVIVPEACVITIAETILPHAHSVIDNLVALVPRSGNANNHKTG